jgi:hypothetical protein
MSLPPFRTVVTISGIAAALALAGYAVLVVTKTAGWVTPEAPPSVAEHEAEEARLEAQVRGVVPARSQSVFGDHDDFERAADPSSEISPSDARAGFDHVMRRVETLGTSRRRLTQAQWQETWRTANDAYAALSLHLDAGDPTERAELEDAHRRLTEALRNVRVRGGKFGPA